MQNYQTISSYNLRIEHEDAALLMPSFLLYIIYDVTTHKLIYHEVIYTLYHILKLQLKCIGGKVKV